MGTIGGLSENAGEFAVEWSIMEFLSLPSEVDTFYISPVFSFAGASWKMQIYPNGRKRCFVNKELRNTEGFVAVYLNRITPGPPIHLKYSLGLKTLNGNVNPEYNCTYNFQEIEGYGFSKFLSRSELLEKKSELVPSDVLTLVCKIKYPKTAGISSITVTEKCPYCKSSMDANEDLSSHQQKCMDKPIKCPECSDVVALKDWHCHKCETTGAEGNTATEKCSYCKSSLDAHEDLSSHQKKCMEKPIKCPECSEVVALKDWYGHQCQKTGAEADERFQEKSRNACVDISTQTEVQNEINQQSVVELNKADTSEVANSDEIEVSSSNQTGATETKEPEEIKQQSTDELNKADTSDVSRSDETEDSFSDDTETKEPEEIKQQSTAELNKADTSKVYRNGETEVSGSDDTETKEPVSFTRRLEERDLVTDVNDLLKEKRGMDVTFELETSNGKTEFFAHQLILAMRSPYFADLFYGQGKNKGQQFIRLKGIDTKAFEQMIRYCYDYKPCLKTTEDACALFKAAFEFKVINLQNLCHAFFMHTKIEPENVFNILKISEEMEDKSLKDRCHKILQEKTREVMATYNLCDVTPGMVHTILDLPKLSLNSEYELFKWLFDWAKGKFEDEDSSSGNAREHLKKFLQNVNFLALTLEEFAMLCKDNQDFFKSDEIANVFLNIAFPGARDMPDWYENDLKCRVYTGSKEYGSLKILN